MPTIHVQTPAGASRIRPSPGCRSSPPHQQRSAGAAAGAARARVLPAPGDGAAHLARLRRAAGPPPSHPSPAPGAPCFAPLGEVVGVSVPDADQGLQAVCSQGPNPAPGRDAWPGAGAVLEPREGRSRGTASAAARSPARTAGGAEAGAGAAEPSRGQRSRSARPLHFSA